MDRLNKFKKQNMEDKITKLTKLPKCRFCGKRFKSRSHFDALCDFCWADNEMRPYQSFRGFRRYGMVS